MPFWIGFMKISGKDFMAWFDSWDPPRGYFWDSDFLVHGVVDPLHDPEGNWKLEPGTIYDLDHLGEISREDRSVPECDTVKTLSDWLERRGKDIVTLLVGKNHVRSVETAVRNAGGKVVRTKAPAGFFTGADFLDWYARGFPEGCVFEERDVDATRLDGDQCTIAPDGIYGEDDIGDLLPEVPDGPCPDLLRDVRRHARARTAVPVVVLLDPSRVDELAELSRATLAPEDLASGEEPVVPSEFRI